MIGPRKINMTDELKQLGCSCHTMAPCSFCMEMTEEEADIMWNEGRQGLERFWRQLYLDEPQNGWVTFFDYEK